VRRLPGRVRVVGRRRRHPAGETEDVAVPEGDDRLQGERAADQAQRPRRPPWRERRARLDRAVGRKAPRELGRERRQRRAPLPAGAVPGDDREEALLDEHELDASRRRVGGEPRVRARRLAPVPALLEVDPERRGRVGHAVELDLDVLAAGGVVLDRRLLEPELEEDLGAAVDVTVERAPGEHPRLSRRLPGARGVREREQGSVARGGREERCGERERAGHARATVMRAGSATPSPSFSA
jgi:hypothetical protein